MTIHSGESTSRAPKPHFEKLRQLAANVANMTISPDGKKLLYTKATRGKSEFYLSQVDGTEPHLLYSIPYERVNSVTWSPDGSRMAFSAEPVVMQISPSHLFVATAVTGKPQRVLEKFDQATPIGWSQDGKNLFLDGGSWENSDIWNLRIADNKLTRIASGAGMWGAQTDGQFIYFTRPGRPFSLVRIPASGGPEKPVASDVFNFLILRGRYLFYDRQDGNPPTPQSINFYRFDLTAHTLKLIDKSVGSQSPMSRDQRFVYAELHNPTRRDVMIVQNWK